MGERTLKFRTSDVTWQLCEVQHQKLDHWPHKPLIVRRPDSFLQCVAS
jgi:hypothetical protein